MRCSKLVAALTTLTAAFAQQRVDVDDTDLSITYAPREGWTYHLNQHLERGYYNNSHAYSQQQGATITWTFRGTHVEYWAPTDPEDGLCRVTIDGGNDATVTSNGTQAGPSIMVFERSNLDPTVEHTIVITVVDAPSFCELDRFVYTPVDTTSTASTSTASSIGGDSGSSTSPQTNNDAHGNSTKSQPPWGIIGGVLAAVLSLAILLVVALCLRRRRLQQNGERMAQQLEIVPSAAAELHSVAWPPVVGTGVGKHRRADAIPMPPIGVASSSGRSIVTSTGKRSIFSSDTQTSVESPGASEGGGLPMMSRPLVQHTDAGPEELPPTYNDRWQGS